MARPVTRPPLRVHWHKSESGKWLSLKNLDLAHHLVKHQGVYIVFDPSDTLYGVLYVGQGNVDERLSEHKKDERILELADLDELYGPGLSSQERIREKALNASWRIRLIQW